MYSQGQTPLGLSNPAATNTNMRDSMTGVNSSATSGNQSSSNNLKSYIQDLKKVAQSNKNKRGGAVQQTGNS